MKNILLYTAHCDNSASCKIKGNLVRETHTGDCSQKNLRHSVGRLPVPCTDHTARHGPGVILGVPGEDLVGVDPVSVLRHPPSCYVEYTGHTGTPHPPQRSRQLVYLPPLSSALILQVACVA